MVSNSRVKHSLLPMPCQAFLSFVTNLKQRRHWTECLSASEQEYLSKILSLKQKQCYLTLKEQFKNIFAF